MLCELARCVLCGIGQTSMQILMATTEGISSGYSILSELLIVCGIQVHCYLGSLLCGCAPLLLLTTRGNTFARLRLLGLFNNLSTSPFSAHKEEAWELGCGAILLLLQWTLKRR